MSKFKNRNVQSTISKTYTSTLQDRVTRIPLKIGVNSGAPEEWACHTPHVTPVVLLLLKTWF
jgi:hypothetical protein